MSTDDDLEQLRDELRRLWRATKGGRWEATRAAGSGSIHLYATTTRGGGWLVAQPNGFETAQLMAAARNALPVLFAEIDRLRGGRVPVVGEVGEGGRVSWTRPGPWSSAPAT